MAHKHKSNRASAWGAKSVAKRSGWSGSQGMGTRVWCGPRGTDGMSDVERWGTIKVTEGYRSKISRSTHPNAPRCPKE